jgi:chromosomal replication initiator protein
MNPSIVISIVSRHFGVGEDVLLGKSRVQAASYPRKIACLLMREFCYLSYESIGNLLTYRDHSTVMYYVKNVTEKLEAGDRRLQAHVDFLRKAIQNVQALASPNDPEESQQPAAGHA